MTNQQREFWERAFLAQMAIAPGDPVNLIRSRADHALAQWIEATNNQPLPESPASASGGSIRVGGANASDPVGTATEQAYAKLVEVGLLGGIRMNAIPPNLDVLADQSTVIQFKHACRAVLECLRAAKA